MSSFYAHVCKNGHAAIDYRRVRPGETCRQCGAELMDACPVCGHFIKKWHYYGSVVLGPKRADFQVPQHCARCGSPFPWTPCKNP